MFATACYSLLQGNQTASPGPDACSNSFYTYQGWSMNTRCTPFLMAWKKRTGSPSTLMTTEVSQQSEY